MSRLIEVNHVALGGEIGSPDWAFPYLDQQHLDYASRTLDGAEALLLGRKTFEGLSGAYTAMPSNPFVDRMNSIPKYVASTTLHELEWNATVIEGDIATFVDDLNGARPAISSSMGTASSMCLSWTMALSMSFIYSSPLSPSGWVSTCSNRLKAVPG
jgi:hypothetical protein